MKLLQLIWCRLFYLRDAIGLRSKLVLSSYFLKILRRCGVNGLKFKKEVSANIGGIEIHFASNSAEFTPYKEVFLHNIYELHPAFVPQPEYIIFGLGADIGFYSLEVGKRLRGGQIFCFEPNPYACSRLIQNVRRNRLRCVTSFQYAIGDRLETATLSRSPLTTGGSITTEKAGYQVPIITLDYVRQKQSLGSIDLVKMDLEGWELRILKGARKALDEHAIKRIVMEYYGESLLHKIELLLTGKGLEEVLKTSSYAYFLLSSSGAST